MGISRGPSPIVTDGLVFAADAGNPRCYTSGSATGIDLISDITLSPINDTVYDSAGGGCWKFGGTDSTIGIGTTQLITDAAAFTVEAWVNLDNFTVTYPVVFTSKTNNAQNWRLIFSSNPSYGDISFGSQSSFALGKTGDISITTDTWYHVIVTFNGNSSTTLSDYKMYVNSEEKSLLAAGGYGPDADNGAIGSEGDGTNNEWDGYIASVKVYNKELSLSEIKQNYNSQKVRFGL